MSSQILETLLGLLDVYCKVITKMAIFVGNN